MDYILLVSVLLSFLLTLLVLPMWIKKAHDVGLLWQDMNKYSRPKNVAASGGIIVIMSFVLSVFFYIFLKTFILSRSSFEVEIFALLATVLLFGLVGLTDDLLGWKNGGLSTRVRIALAILASVPLIVINAGTSTMDLPFFGSIEFGILYPLIIIPLAIGFVSTTYNFLAGFNGLETGLGILILTYLSFVAFATGTPYLSVVGLCMSASLLAFWFFNKCPAKVFPGDILTYSIGALIVIMAILGNFEKIAVIVYIPFLIEVALKMRGGLKMPSFARPRKDGSLAVPYKKLYGLTHFSVWFLERFEKKVREKDVVYLIYSIEIFFILLATIFLFFF